MFGRKKIIKAPERFKQITYRFQVHALTHCAMLLGTFLGGGVGRWGLCNYIDLSCSLFTSMEVPGTNVMSLEVRHNGGFPATTWARHELFFLLHVCDHPYTIK